MKFKPQKSFIKSTQSYWLPISLIVLLFIITSSPYLNFVSKLLELALSVYGIVIGIVFTINEFTDKFPPKKRISSTLLIIVIFSASIFEFTKTFPCLPDIPYWILSKYSHIEGYPVNIKKNYSSKTTYQKFSIDGINFQVSPANTFKEIGTGKYRITYLPYSKYVINIEYAYD